MGMLVVSPHLDDAVFSCAGFLAAAPGSTVLTVFAGVPADAEATATEWDRRCGFANAAAAMQARRAEDRSALALLGARPIWFDLLDSQYAAPASDNNENDALLRALTTALAPFAGYTTVLIPLGLFHADHLRVHRACRAALGASATANVFAYEDAIYRAMPGVLAGRFAALAEEGTACALQALPVEATPVVQAAIAAYVSQLPAFSDEARADLAQPPRAWRLRRDDPAAP